MNSHFLFKFILKNCLKPKTGGVSVKIILKREVKKRGEKSKNWLLRHDFIGLGLSHNLTRLIRYRNCILLVLPKVT